MYLIKLIRKYDYFFDGQVTYTNNISKKKNFGDMIYFPHLKELLHLKSKKVYKLNEQIIDIDRLPNGKFVSITSQNLMILNPEDPRDEITVRLFFGASQIFVIKGKVFLISKQMRHIPLDDLPFKQLIIKYDYFFEAHLLGTLRGHSDIYQVVTTEGKIVVARQSGVLEVWDLKTLKRDYTISGETYPVNLFVYKNIIVYATASSLIFLDLNTGALISDYDQEDIIRSIVNLDDQILIASGNTLSFYTDKLENQIVFESNITALLIVNENILIALTDRLNVYDLNFNLLSSSQVSIEYLLSLKIDGDKIVGVSMYGHVYLFNLMNGNPNVLFSFEMTETIFKKPFIISHYLYIDSMGIRKWSLIKGIDYTDNNLVCIAELPNDELITVSKNGDIRASNQFFSIDDIISNILVTKTKVIIVGEQKLYIYE